MKYKKLSIILALFAILSFGDLAFADSPQPKILLVLDAHWDPARTDETWGIRNVAPYYINVLNALGLKYDNCTVDEANDDGPGYDIPGCNENRMLKDYDIVIWFTGNDGRGTVEETLKTFDRNATKYFLDNGGKLFLTGQDIGYECYNLWSPSCNNNPFYADYLHAQWVKDDSEDTGLIGQANDPIGNGLLPAIDGGAKNQEYQSIIFYRIGDSLYDINTFYYDLVKDKIRWVGTTCRCGNVKIDWTFCSLYKDHYCIVGDDGTVYHGSFQFKLPAGVRNHTKGSLGYKVVYSAFGFEGIASESDRTEIMNRTINYFKGPVVLGTKVYARNFGDTAWENLNLTCDPNDAYCLRKRNPLINATCREDQLFAKVTGGEYFIQDTEPTRAQYQSGTFMDASDGLFDTSFEAVNRTIVTLPPEGLNKIWVHCNNTDNYYGKFDVAYFTVDKTRPSTGTVIIEDGKAYTNKTKPKIAFTLEYPYPPDFMAFSCNATAFNNIESAITSENKPSWDDIGKFTEFVSYQNPYFGFDITNTTVACPADDGSRTVYVLFLDRAGNLRTFGSDSIILDRIPPRIYQIIPANNSWVKSIDNITIIFYDPVLPDGTPGANVHVNFTSNGTAGVTQPLYNNTPFNPGWVNEGWNLLQVWINDTAGNLNYTAFRFGVDDTAPTVIIDHPLVNSTLSGVIDLKTTISDILTIRDPGSGIDKAWYQVMNASNLSQVFASGLLSPPDFDTTWNSVSSIPTNQTVIFNVSANDTLGWLTFNVNVTFFVDNRLPQVKINFPDKLFLNKDFSLDLITISPGAPDVNISRALYNISNETWFKVNDTGILSPPPPSYNFTDFVNLSAFCDGPCSGGNYTIFLWANNTVNLQANVTSWFFIDRIPPEVSNYTINLILDPTFNDYRIYPDEIVRFSVNVTENVTEVDKVLITIVNPAGISTNQTLSLTAGNRKSGIWQLDFSPTQLGNYLFTKLFVNDTLGNLFVNDTLGISFLVVNGSVRITFNSTNETDAGKSYIFSLAFEFNKTFSSPNLLIYIPPNAPGNTNLTPNYINLSAFTCEFGLEGCDVSYKFDTQPYITWINATGIGSSITLSLTTPKTKATTPPEDTSDNWIVTFRKVNFANVTKIRTPFLNITRIFCDESTDCIVYQNRAFNLTVEIENVNLPQHTGKAYEVYVSYNNTSAIFTKLIPTTDLDSGVKVNVTWEGINISEAGNYTFYFDAWEFNKKYNATQVAKLIQVKDTVPPTIISTRWEEDNIFNINETVPYYIRIRDNVVISQVWVEINQSTGFVKNETAVFSSRIGTDEEWKLSYTNTSRVGNYSILTVYANDTENNVAKFIPQGNLVWFEVRELIITAAVAKATLTINETQRIYANVTGNASAIESVIGRIAKPRDYVDATEFIFIGNISDIYLFEANYTNVTRSGNYSINLTVTLSSGINATAFTEFNVSFGNVTIDVWKDLIYLPIGKVFNLTFFIIPENGDLISVNGSLFIDNATVINFTSTLPQNQSFGNIYWEEWKSYPAKWEINATGIGSTNVTVHINSTTPSEPIERQNATRVINVTVIPEDTNAPLIIDFGHELDKLNLFEPNKIWINATDPTTLVEDVLVEINYTTGTKENLTASRVAPDYFELIFSNANATGNYSYRVFARDLAGNENVSSYKHFFAFDNYSVQITTDHNIYNLRERVWIKVSVKNVNNLDVKDFNLTLILQKATLPNETLIENVVTDEYSYTIKAEDPAEEKLGDTPKTYWAYAQVNKNGNKGEEKVSFKVSKILPIKVLSPKGFVEPGSAVNISLEVVNQRGEPVSGAAVVATCIYIDPATSETKSCPTYTLSIPEVGSYQSIGVMRIPNISYEKEFIEIRFDAVQGGNRDEFGPLPLTKLFTKLPTAAPPAAPAPAVAPPACECADWEYIGCGLSGCKDTEMFMIRSCKPAGCAPEKQCLEIPACIIGDFELTLPEAIEMPRGEDRKAIGTLKNIGIAPLTIKLSAEAENISVSLPITVVDLPLKAEKSFDVLIHAPLTIEKEREYLLKIKATGITPENVNITKLKSFKVRVTENPLIPRLDELERKLKELEVIIGEYERVGINVQTLKELLANAKEKVKIGAEAIKADNLPQLARTVGEIEGIVKDLELKLLALRLRKFLLEHRWNILAIVIVAIFSSYFVTQVAIPYHRLGKEIKKLVEEEKSLVASRVETEKQYFMRKIDEKTFFTLMAEKQGKILRVRADIARKTKERRAFIIARLHPRVMALWFKGGIIGLAVYFKNLPRLIYERIVRKRAVTPPRIPVKPKLARPRFELPRELRYRLWKLKHKIKCLFEKTK